MQIHVVQFSSGFTVRVRPRPLKHSFKDKVDDIHSYNNKAEDRHENNPLSATPVLAKVQIEGLQLSSLNQHKGAAFVAVELGCVCITSRRSRFPDTAHCLQVTRSQVTCLQLPFRETWTFMCHSCIPTASLGAEGKSQFPGAQAHRSPENLKQPHCSLLKPFHQEQEVSHLVFVVALTKEHKTWFMTSVRTHVQPCPSHEDPADPWARLPPRPVPGQRLNKQRC